MTLSNEQNIRFIHPRLTVLRSSPEQPANQPDPEMIIADFKNQNMNLTTPSSTGSSFTWTKWETNRPGLWKSIKDFFADLFSDKDYLQKKEQFMLIKELQLKTFEIEHLKRDLAEKEAALKKISYHQSHTMRRPLANILGITRLIHAYLKEHPDADLTQLISFLQLSSNELDEVIKNNS